MRVLLLALLLSAGVAAPALGADGRLRELSIVETAILGDPGTLLAGDVPVLAGPRRLYGWPTGGGGPSVLSRLPDLGPIHPDGVFTTGDIRVWAAQPGRVAVARSGGAPIAPDFDRRRGHQLVVGPPAGPWHDPAGCGEASGGPAALDGDRLAYVAAPAAKPGCAAGAVPAVTGRSIVIRDLAGADAVRAVVPVPRGRRALAGLQLSGPFLAYAWRGEELAVGAAVVDLRDGRELAAARPVELRQWALLPDGGLAVTQPPSQLGDDLCGTGNRASVLRDGAPAQALAVDPCLLALFAVREGRLVFGERRPDGRVDTVGLDVATGARDRLAIGSGPPIDVSAGRLVLDDRTCTSFDLRIVTRSAATAGPAGPRRCPARVGTLRRAGAGFALPVRCPRGCSLELRGPARDFGTAEWRSVDLPPGGRTVRLRGREAGSRPVVRITVNHPVGRPTRVVRRLR